MIRDELSFCWSDGQLGCYCSNNLHRYVLYFKDFILDVDSSKEAAN